MIEELLIDGERTASEIDLCCAGGGDRRGIGDELIAR
jgi:hypothetical protein